MNFTEIDYETFKQVITDIRNTHLDVCVRNNNTYMTGYLIRWGDLKVYPKKYQGELEVYSIQNSKSNRDASIHEKSKKLAKKLSYGIRIMGGNSSFNFLPLGMLNDTIALQAEDRGHEGAVLFFYYDKKWPVSVWKRAIAVLDSELTDDERTTDTKLIVSSLSEKLKDKKIKELSFSEIVPLNIKKKKDDVFVPIEVKVYPTRKMHRREILGINNTEDSWTTHQKSVMEAEIVLDEIYGVGNDYTDIIYQKVEGTDLFQGLKTMLSRHEKMGAKMERYEEEPIWLWMSARESESTSGLERYRAFDSSTESARIKRYKKFVETVKRKKLENQVESEVEFLTNVSDCVEISNFENIIDQVVTKHSGKSTTNINDLSVSKPDAALQMSDIIRTFMESRSSRMTRDAVLNISNTVFKLSSDLLMDDDVQLGLIQSGTGAKGRYDNFYSKLEEILENLSYEDVNDVKGTLISMAKQLLDSSLNPNGNIPMIDRDKNSKSTFKIVMVNVTNGVGFDKGHKNAGVDGKDITNHFLQFSGDNQFWSNKRDFEPSTYADEYLMSVKEFMNNHNLMENDDWQDAYQNTRKFVKNVWK